MMGIRPNRDGLIPPVTPDNPESRYSDWLTDLEDSGEIVGGVWKETDAKATSANQSASDIAGRTTQYVDSTMGEPDRIPVTGAGGWLYSRDNPTHSNHLARKGYVDQQIASVSALTEISGTGWEAQKRGGVVVVYLRGANTGWTMPAGWRPKNTVYAPVIDFSDSPLPKRRVAITSGGTVSLFDTSGNVFGNVTYIAT